MTDSGLAAAVPRYCPWCGSEIERWGHDDNCGRPDKVQLHVGLTVTHWISRHAADKKVESVGGVGGWFDHGDTWQSYLDTWDESVHPYLEAIKIDVMASGRFVTGQQHQDADDGVPLFSDGTVAGFSWRAMGDLMAAIATVKDGQTHNYMEWYM